VRESDATSVDELFCSRRTDTGHGLNQIGVYRSCSAVGVVVESRRHYRLTHACMTLLCFNRHLAIVTYRDVAIARTSKQVDPRQNTRLLDQRMLMLVLRSDRHRRAHRRPLTASPVVCHCERHFCSDLRPFESLEFRMLSDTSRYNHIVVKWSHDNLSPHLSLLACLSMVNSAIGKRPYRSLHKLTLHCTAPCDVGHAQSSYSTAILMHPPASPKTPNTDLSLVAITGQNKRCRPAPRSSRLSEVQSFYTR